MAHRRFFVGGNFKMNGTLASLNKLVEGLNSATLDAQVEVVVAPPTIQVIACRQALRADVAVATQNVYEKASGAFTGEISAAQARDAGATWTLLGHSERRSAPMSESADFVARKTRHVVVDEKLGVILCCGESLAEREAGKTLDVVRTQLQPVAQQIKDAPGAWDRIVIAYEPVWAIGTGKVATAEQAQEVHADIRRWLRSNVSQDVAENTRIVYGGSVTEKNCGELGRQPDIDGFLVGGASLKPAFIDIINSRPRD